MKTSSKTLLILLLFFGSVFILSDTASAAVGFGRGSSSTDATPGTSITWNHTANATDTTLFIGVGSPSVASSSFGGRALTQIQDIAGDNRWKTYYLASTSIGTLPIVVQFSNTDNATGIAMTVNGSVTSSDVIGVTATSTCVTCNSVSRSFTTTRAGSLNLDTVFMNGAWTKTTNVTTGVSQTMRASCELFGNDLANQGSSQPAPTAQSYTMGWSWTGLTNMRYAVIEFRSATLDEGGFSPYIRNPKGPKGAGVSRDPSR